MAEPFVEAIFAGVDAAELKSLLDKPVGDIGWVRVDLSKSNVVAPNGDPVNTSTPVRWIILHETVMFNHYHVTFDELRRGILRAELTREPDGG